ncbi:hypothetical protein ACVXG7_08780 [Enterobacter hormaechei]
MVTGEGLPIWRGIGPEGALPVADRRRSAGHAQQVRKVIDLVKKHHIPAVFSESTVSDSPPVRWRVKPAPTMAACCTSTL